jgi:hypothetical protein
MNPNKSFRRVVLAQKMSRGLFDLAVGARQRDFQKVAAPSQSFQMFAPKKRLSIGDANGFEQPIAIKKTAIVDRQSSAIRRNEFSINESKHVALLLRGSAFGEANSDAQRKMRPSR